MHKTSNMKKPKTLRPLKPIVAERSCSDSDGQFELELCWCVQQLETALNSGKLSQKVAEDTFKNLKILKGNDAPLIKKRQVMKASMGDYRAKMKQEEKKMCLASKKIKFTNTAEMKKSSFVKKSAFLTSGKDFKFNFDTVTAKDIQAEELPDDTKEKSDGKNLNLTLGSGFQFNFVIEDENTEIKLDTLSIK